MFQSDERVDVVGERDLGYLDTFYLAFEECPNISFGGTFGQICYHDTEVCSSVALNIDDLVLTRHSALENGKHQVQHYYEYCICSLVKLVYHVTVVEASAVVCDRQSMNPVVLARIQGIVSETCVPIIGFKNFAQVYEKENCQYHDKIDQAGEV